MGFGLETVKPFSGGWNVAAAARSRDACKSVSAAAFCRVDSLFLCIACDTKIHSFTRHERVLRCEVCDQAPAVVTCKSDAASLCVTCDSDIHSANPLSSRHERVPVESFFDSAATAAAKFSASAFGLLGDSTAVPVMGQSQDLGFGPWLLPNDFADTEPAKVETKASNFVFSGFDFEYPPVNNAGLDGIVPVQTKTEPILITNSDHCFEIDFCRSKLSAFTYPTQSINNSVSTPSLEYGVVPESNSSAAELAIPVNRRTILTG